MKNNKKINKILLAYSGGLDTSVCISWLKEKYDAEVITYTASLGQKINWKKTKEKALKTGAKKVYIENLETEFVEGYIKKAVKANALYENKYPLATALGRPLIAKKMVEIAKKENIDALAHGCTGKGNDQVRFEVGFKALAPDLEILAPLREWEFISRDDEIEYAKINNISIDVTKKSPYSIDQNIWGVSVECGKLEDPWQDPPKDAYQWTNHLDETPDNICQLEIGFSKGVPISLNGSVIKFKEIIKKLNSLGSEYGIGRIDLVENRLIGIKSHEIYESPAAEILIKAHIALEELTLDKETQHFKNQISNKYSQLIYDGLWYSPLRKSFDAFIDQTQKNITGTVKIKLYKGNCIVTGRKSNYSLYNYGLATYDKDDKFDHKSAKGFINMWALPIQIANNIGDKIYKEKEKIL